MLRREALDSLHAASESRVVYGFFSGSQLIVPGRNQPDPIRFSGGIITTDKADIWNEGPLPRARRRRDAESRQEPILCIMCNT